MFSMSSVNLLCPYTYITETSSAKAIRVSPVAPKLKKKKKSVICHSLVSSAESYNHLSNKVSQYSPAPVVKMVPMLKYHGVR